MTDIHNTAYPILRPDIGPKQLADCYRPTEEEIEWARDNTISPKRRIALLIQLKVVQNVGYFPMLRDVPRAITRFVALGAGFGRELTTQELESGDGSSVRQPTLKLLRAKRQMRVLDEGGTVWLKGKAEEASETMYRVEDVINVLLELMVKHHYEFPPFSTLDKLAQAARTDINDRYLDTLAAQISTAGKEQIDKLFEVRPGMSTSGWQQVKREPKKPTGSETREYLKHVRWLVSLVEILPTIDIPVAKLRHLQEWAHKEDAADMKRLRPNRRYALCAILIKSRLSQAFDDVGNMFGRLMANLETNAKRKLLEHQVEQQKETDALVLQLREMLLAYMVAGSAPKRLDAIEVSLQADPEALVARCDALLAYANRNHFPFMLEPYAFIRSQLFNCLEVVTLSSTSEDKATERWIAVLKRLRHARGEVLELKDYELDARQDFKWIPEQLRDLVLVKPELRRATTQAKRKFLEIAIFRQIHLELKSGDLCIAYGDEYRDWREEMVTPEEYAEDLKTYTEISGVETDGVKLCSQLKAEFIALALAVDQRMPSNEQVKIVDGRPSVKRIPKQERPAEVEALDRKIGERMPQVSICDVFSDAAHWCDLSKLLKPISGLESRIKDRHARFVLTSVCYGCNLGPSQTARSTKLWTRREIAWLNSKYITESLIDRAAKEVINAYAKFELPHFWGSNNAVSVDGTKYDLFEQNLFSQFHIRYGGYGGLGYYVVTGTYIALFSRFNTCGSHESNYMLDWFMANESDLKPNIVHGDTHSQNYAGYSLAYLLGVQAMPRIKGFGDYEFYRPSQGMKFKNIGDLFNRNINWDLIETHLPDMLRVIFSLKRGKVTASTVLRRIGTHSSKNKLYIAFRELGAVIRTMFLLRYLDDLVLRQTIHAATNKSEEFNYFVKWVFFGSEGTVQENVRSEQQKLIKYGMLAANMVMLHNVHHMTRVLDELRKEGMEITPEMLEGLSPYRFAHINRLGTYEVNNFGVPDVMEILMPWIKPRPPKAPLKPPPALVSA